MMASNMLLTERVTEAPETRERESTLNLSTRVTPFTPCPRGPVTGQAGS